MDSNFVLLPIARGLQEIMPILTLLKAKDAFICGGYARYCASPNAKSAKAGELTSAEIDELEALLRID